MSPAKTKAQPGAGEAVQRARALPWHEQLAGKLAGDCLPVATMLVGRFADGIEQLALDIACQSLAGTDSAAGQLLDAGSHPDLLIVRRQPATTGKLRQEIVIDQVRELVEFMQMTPRLARIRIAVIAPACRLNRSAANSLLKILEEPPAPGRFLLAAEQPERLPATVRSRTRIVAATAPQKQQAIDWLKKNHPQLANPQDALTAAAGAPLAALAMHERARERKLFVKLVCGNADLLAAGRELAELPIEIWLEWAQYWVSDLIAASLKLQPRMFPEAGDMPRSGNLMRLLAAGRELQEMRRLAQHPVNARQMLERVTIRLQQLQPRS